MNAPDEGQARVRILVIEDDLGLSELMREEFAHRHWDFHHCRTGREAVAWLEAFGATLVLLDYSLPDMTGSSLLDRVAMPPFIVTTGAGDERIAVEMMKKGALDYLVKDALFLETMPGVVERALSNLETRRRLAQTEADLRLATENLRQAKKMESLGLMAGGVAHDFNNLFQALQGNLEGAIRKVPGGTARPFLDKALAILAKATALTHRMLDYTGKGLRNAGILDLNALVLEALAALPGAEVQFQGQEGLPPLEGDSEQLIQVITGLVLNALEAQGGGGGPIRLSTGLCRPDPGAGGPGVWIQAPPPGEEILFLRVEDSGTGMSSAVLERAFDPFFTTRRPGRGLGLSAALGILRGHDAGLWVQTAPDQGSLFQLHFAPVAPEQPGATPLAAPWGGPSLGRTILLVDDDEDLQETLAEFLREGLGYRVLQARDGVEAVEAYRREMDAIGVVLMDATMPRLGGPEAFSAILAFAPGAKGILCSGFSEETGSRTALASGFKEFLKKPFSLRALEAALERALGA